MRFTRRDMMMIEYLRDYEVLELDSMSEYLGVSVKTLKNQLKELAEILKEFGVDIRFVSGNQLMVRGCLLYTSNSFPRRIRRSWNGYISIYPDSRRIK